MASINQNTLLLVAGGGVLAYLLLRPQPQGSQVGGAQVISAGGELFQGIGDAFGGIGDALFGAGSGLGAAALGIGTGGGAFAQGTGTGLSNAFSGFGQGVAGVGQGINLVETGLGEFTYNLGRGIYQSTSGISTITTPIVNAPANLAQSGGILGALFGNSGNSVLNIFNRDKLNAPNRTTASQFIGAGRSTAGRSANSNPSTVADVFGGTQSSQTIFLSGGSTTGNSSSNAGSPNRSTNLLASKSNVELLTKRSIAPSFRRF